nr:hypothetical protein [Burkholderia territorii]
MQYVWKLERGVKPPPSVEQIERIAAALAMGEADVASLLRPRSTRKRSCGYLTTCTRIRCV